MLRNDEIQYGSVAKWFHWLIAFAVITLLIVGLLMGDFEKPFRFTVYNIHKLVGLTVLTLMIMRIIWTFNNTRPPMPLTTPTWERFAARSVHLLLYVTVLLMPISGWIMSTAAGHSPMLGSLALPMPGVIEDKALAKLTNQIHSTLGWTIIGLVSLHTLAAIKHHFIDKDNVLKRMLPGRLS